MTTACNRAAGGARRRRNRPAPGRGRRRTRDCGTGWRCPARSGCRRSSCCRWLLVLALSFGTTDNHFNPHFGTSLANVKALVDDAYLKVGLRSLVYAALTAVICLVIAYPVAYAIALYGGRFKNALIAAIVVPFFANYLVRMFGWSVLLGDDGPMLKAGRKLGLPAVVPHPQHQRRRDPRPGVRLRRLHGAAAVRGPGADGRVADRGRPRPVRRPAAHVPDGDRAGHPAGRARRPRARLPARRRRLRQRAAHGRTRPVS